MKNKILSAGVLFVVIAAFGLVGLANAQTPNPPNPQAPQTPAGPGMWSRGRMMPGGMGGWQRSGEVGFMHEYMQAALAEALGFSLDEIEAAQKDGKTVWQLAQEKGLTLEEFQAAMTSARQKAIEKMVADGLLTQEQADWMLSRMQNMWGGGFGGRGGCPGMDGDFYGPRGRGGYPQSPAPANPPTTNTTNF